MLFIKKIIEEDSAGKEGGNIESNCSELVQVKEAVDRLNGESKTAVVLKRDEQNFMIIGGGKEGKYVVTAHFKGKLYYLTNKFNIPKAPIELLVGGKSGMYQSKRCVSISMALEAAKHFADRGSLAQVFSWDTS